MNDPEIDREERKAAREPVRESPRSEKDIAAELRLRPDPPRVMRLSRKTMAVLAGSGGLGLAAILMVALQDGGSIDGPEELFSTERVQQAEGLTQLPRDYGDVPRLGPPLPGELGRPVLSAQRRGEPVPVPPVAGPAVPAIDPEEQRRLQELEAARLSRLFAEANTAFRASEESAGLPAPPSTDLTGLFPAAAAQTAPRDAVDRREDFLDREVDRRTTAADRLQPPPSSYVLQAGSVIEAALITGLRSDLPGQISAQVTANVYDSPTGRFLLIPQGSRLLGEYDSRVAAEQSRLLLAWTRLILPDGRSIVLERQPGADTQGYAGLEDGVDYHWWDLAKAAGLSTLLAVGAELTMDDDERLIQAIRNGAQDTINDAGQQIVQRQLQVVPTLTIRPGFPVRVIVTRDLVLEPYGG